MNRPLGHFETAAALSHDYAPFVVVLALELDGGAPSPARFAEILAALRERQPLLQVRIVASGDGYRYAADGVPPIPLSVVERTAEELWQEVAERELNRRIDDRSGPLLRCTYLPPSEGSGRFEVVLTFHHAIVDAISGASLLDQLLDACAAGGRFEPAAPRALGSPPEERLPSRARGLSGAAGRVSFVLRALVDETLFRTRTRGARPAVPPSSKCCILPRCLPREETAALVRAARRRGVTLPAVLNAAFLLGVRRRLHDGRDGPLRYMTFADLRPHLDPSVCTGELGSYITLLRHTVDVGDDDDLWSLAKRITGQVHGALRRGDRLVSATLCDTMIRLALRQREQRMATVGVSYTGSTGLERRYGELEVRRVHGFVSNFDLGPELTAQVKLLRGELALDIVYLDAEMDRRAAEALAAEILEMLGREEGQTTR